MASSSSRASRSPSSAAARNRSSRASRAASSGSKRGRPASRCFRARVTSCREFDLGLLDDVGDLRVLVAEHLAQQVGRALDRGQPLQEHEQRQRQRIRELGMRGRAERRVLDQRLRQPGPDIRLATGARRLEDIDREPRRHGRDPGGGLVDRAFLARQAQQRLLGHVLGLRDAAEHPVRHAEAVSPQRLELPVAHTMPRPRPCVSPTPHRRLITLDNAGDRL